jgi:trehalose-6-phosphatase
VTRDGDESVTMERAAQRALVLDFDGTLTRAAA